jgi:hypothetical protein
MPQNSFLYSKLKFNGEKLILFITLKPENWRQRKVTHAVGGLFSQHHGRFCISASILSPIPFFHLSLFII